MHYLSVCALYSFIGIMVKLNYRILRIMRDLCSYQKDIPITLYENYIPPTLYHALHYIYKISSFSGEIAVIDTCVIYECYTDSVHIFMH